MKIHLPLFLRKSLLALYSSAMVIGAISEGVANIYSWTGASNNHLHEAGNYDPEFEGAWQSIWSGTAANIIKFTDITTTNKSPNVSFNTLSLAGLWVEAGAEGYNLVPNGNNTRDINFRATTADDATAMGGIAGKTNFIVANDFVIGSASAVWKNVYFYADSDMNISSGKSMTLYAKTLQGSGASRNMNIHGGGNLKLAGLTVANDTLAFTNLTWNISGNSALDLSAMTTATSVNMGTLSLSGGNVLLAAETNHFTANLTIGGTGSSISGASDLTLSGNLFYTGESLSSLSLGASNITLGDTLTIDLGSEVADGTYTLLTTTGTLTGNMDQFNVARNAHYSIDGSSLKVTISGDVGDLIWKGGNGTWGAGLTTDSEWNSNTVLTNYHFFNGDAVTFGTDADTAETVGTISLVSNVLPSAMTVTGAGTWTIDTDGSFGIQGAGALVKNGSGTLILNTDNSFSGGTTLNAGTIVLGSATALGTGNLIFNAGTIKYGEGITTDLSGKLSIAEGVLTENNKLNIDVNGNGVTWANAVTNLGWVNLMNSSTTAGALNFGANAGGMNFTIGATATLNLTVANSATTMISGAGTLNVSNSSGNITLGSLSGFTGTINRNQTGSSALIFNVANTAEQRFNLNTGSDTTQKQAVIIGSNTIGGSAIYLNNLSGDANLTASNGAIGNRGLNILMTQDNVFNGSFHAANGATDIRWGTVTIGGAHTFKWTGQTVNSGNTYSSIGTNAKLLITGGATMEFAANADKSSGGQWKDDIQIDANSTLLISRDDAVGFVQDLGDTNAISGEGQVIITGNATLAGNNTYSGGTTVQNGSLIVSSLNGLGTGGLTVTGGEVDMNHLEIDQQVTIANGNLKNMDRFVGSVKVNQHLDPNKVVTSSINLGGLAGNKITQLDLGYNLETNEIGTITGVTGNISLTSATLGVNINSLAGAGSTATIDFGTNTGSLSITDSLNLAITNDLAAHMLAERGNIVLQLTSGGGITLGAGADFILDSQYNSIKNLFDVKVSGNGTITLSSSEGNLFVVSKGSSKTITNASDINPLNFDYVVVDGILNISLPNDQTSLDLNGLEGSVAEAKIDTTGSSKDLVLQLNQSGAGDALSSYAGSFVGNAQIQKNDAYKQIIGGSVSTTGLTVKAGELVINGNTTLTQDGTTTIDQGAILALNGQSNNLNTVANNGSLLLGGKNAKTTITSLVQGVGSKLQFSNGAELILGSNGFTITSEITGSGTLTLNQGSLSVGNGGSIGSDTSINLGNQATLNVQGELALGALAGNGTVSFNANSDFVNLGAATNTFKGSFNGAGTVNLTGGGTQTFSGVKNSDQVNLNVSNGTLILANCSFGDLTVDTTSRQTGTAQVIFDITGGEKTPNVTLKSLSSNSGSLTFKTSVNTLFNCRNNR